MRNHSELIEKARKRVKIWKRGEALLAVLASAAYLCFCLKGPAMRSSLAALVIILMIVVVKRILFAKCVRSAGVVELDPELYLAMVYEGDFDSPTATVQLEAECLCGRYQNVIRICEMKLKEPKMAKRYTYAYFHYLACVYFDIGDHENLRRIFEQYEVALATQKWLKRRMWEKRAFRMPFFRSYLRGEWNACMAFADKRQRIPYRKYSFDFYKARVSLAQGKIDEARGYYEALANKVPQLNVGMLAAMTLARMEDQQESTALVCFPELAQINDQTPEVTLHPSRFNQLRTWLLRILVIVMILAALYITVSVLRVFDEDRRYKEDIRVWAEKDYDHVEVVDVFTLKKGDDVVDTMFLCKTDSHIVVGCSYVYKDDPEVWYDTMEEIPLFTLETGDPYIWTHIFSSKTSSYRLTSCVATDKKDLPAYYYMCDFELDGRTFYYAITQIELPSWSF